MNGLFNEMTYFNGVHGASRGHPQALRRPGRPELLPALRGRVGRGGRSAVHLDEAGRRQLRRHPQRAGGPLAAPGSRRRAKSARSGTTSSTSRRPILEAAGLPEPKSVNGTPQAAHRRGEHGLFLRRRQGEETGTRPSTSRSSATGACTTTAGWRTRSTGRLGGEAADPVPRARQVGTLRTSRRTSARRTTWPRRIPEKLKELQALFLKEAAKDTRCRSTIASSSGSTRRPSGGPT